MRSSADARLSSVCAMSRMVRAVRPLAGSANASSNIGVAAAESPFVEHDARARSATCAIVRDDRRPSTSRRSCERLPRTTLPLRRIDPCAAARRAIFDEIGGHGLHDVRREVARSIASASRCSASDSSFLPSSPTTAASVESVCETAGLVRPEQAPLKRECVPQHLLGGLVIAVVPEPSGPPLRGRGRARVRGSVKSSRLRSSARLQERARRLEHAEVAVNVADDREHVGLKLGLIARARSRSAARLDRGSPARSPPRRALPTDRKS